MKTFKDFISEMSYQGMSKEREGRIKKQMTAAKKSAKKASQKGDIAASARHDERHRAMRDRVKRSDLPF
jgi:hypothetical protein